MHVGVTVRWSVCLEIDRILESLMERTAAAAALAVAYLIKPI